MIVLTGTSDDPVRCWTICEYQYRHLRYRGKRGQCARRIRAYRAQVAAGIRRVGR